MQHEEYLSPARLHMKLRQTDDLRPTLTSSVKRISSQCPPHIFLPFSQLWQEEVQNQSKSKTHSRQSKSKTHPRQSKPETHSKAVKTKDGRLQEWVRKRSSHTLSGIQQKGSASQSQRGPAFATHRAKSTVERKDAVDTNRGERRLGYYASGAAFASSRSIVVPPLKRPRLHVSSSPGGGTRSQSQSSLNSATNGNLHQKHQKEKTSSPPPQVKTYSNPDILICGNCREMFSELAELLEHKKEFCKLRFTCKCSTLNGSLKDVEEGVALTCVQCKERYESAWDLMVHVQAAHMLNIYELSAKNNVEDRLTPPPNGDIQKNGQTKVSDEEMETKDHASDEDTHSDTAGPCIVGALSIEPNVDGGIGAQVEIKSLTNGSIKASE
ncbi:uncharacterized protein LOC106663450 [Cimex lectularius]|uniref:C2H2-type domain-containing protein n=1 Tax=Cimex lectularius TaxID=79782 RepID=A0A8I6SV57_CIMLE|nr:uncharacterized protein LOC106663450 [Cimex lectularius]